MKNFIKNILKFSSKIFVQLKKHLKLFNYLNYFTVPRPGKHLHTVKVHTVNETASHKVRLRKFRFIGKREKHWDSVEHNKKTL